MILSGFGGQGLLFAGQVVAEAALAAGKHVTWLPSYGPEMRGGSASCTVIVSDAPIGSPVTDEADVVLALTPPSLARFERALRPGGILVVNASLIEAQPTRTDVEVVDAPCSDIAASAGDERVVSVVALGAALARLQLVGVGFIRAALARGTLHGGAEQLARNLAALDAGLAVGGARVEA